MKSLLLSLTAIVLFSFPTQAQENAKSAGNLVWSDEFSGEGIPNTANWDRPEYNRRNNTSGPDGWWSKEDSYLDGKGNMIIRVRKIANKNDDSDPYDYSVGAVRTKGKFEQRYGKFEMRAQLPTQQGWWVAFWMMQGDVGSTANAGVDGSEVDIMEGWGWTDKINHAVHWDGYEDAHEGIGEVIDIDGLLEGYHIYTLEWYPDKYVFFVDGKETWRTTGGGVCNRPGYIKITGEISTESWAINTWWSNDPKDAIYPDSFVVDYVRVYDFPEGRQAYSGNPDTIPGKIEAENYDHGINGDAYFDHTEGNNGKAYRIDDVDVQVCDEGGFNLAWTEVGEWLEYTVNIPQTGLYNLDLRSASLSTGGTVHLEVDGEDLSGSINLPITADFQTFQTSSTENIVLDQGEHILRLNILEGDFNLNYMDFSQSNILYDLSGIKRKSSYDFDRAIDIGIEASSIAGAVNSIGFFLNNDSLGGAVDSVYFMTYTPHSPEAGWNTFTVNIRDDQGNFFSHSIEIFFGNLPPVIEIFELPADTLFIGEGNVLSVSVTDPDGNIDSLFVSINDYEMKYENVSGIIEFDLDTLSEGEYIFKFEAFDDDGIFTTDSVQFIMKLLPNKLPIVKISSHEDQAVLYRDAGNTITLIASDEDGELVSVELYVDSEIVPEMASEPLRFDIDYLESGTHEIKAKVIDDREDVAIDSITVYVADSLYSDGDWTLYLRNGGLASFSNIDDNLNVCIEQKPENISDIQLIREVAYVTKKSGAKQLASFNASATIDSKIILSVKDNPYSSQLLSFTRYDLTNQLVSFEFFVDSIPGYINFFSFYLGYKNEVCYTITDFWQNALGSSDETEILIDPFIYPNPANDIVYFREASDYQLITITGKLIRQGTDTNSIDITDLNQGMYFLKTEQGLYKFVKE